ncbi:MAG: hypothetical protein AAF725_06105 [Acidobacteriota bacterium]
MPHQTPPRVLAALLVFIACGSRPAASSDPCSGYNHSNYACSGYCIWSDGDDPDKQDTDSFTAEVVSSIGYAEVTRFGTQDNVLVTFDPPLDSETTITDLTAVISGFYVELKDAKTIHEIKVEADVVTDTIGPCGEEPCILSAIVTPYLKVDHHGNASDNIKKAFIKVAAIGKQVFNGCDAGIPIIPWSSELTVDLTDSDHAPWTVQGLSADGEDVIKNYPFQSQQPIMPIAFFSSFSLEFGDDQEFQKLVVDPDVGLFEDGQFQSSMSYDDSTGLIQGDYQLQLTSDTKDAVDGSGQIVVMANALQNSPFALPSGSVATWYKTQRSGAENKEVGMEQEKFVFSSHPVDPAPAPPALLRTLEVSVPSPISFCGLSWTGEYFPQVSTTAAGSEGDDGPSGLAMTLFSMSVAGDGASDACDAVADDAEGSVKTFLVAQEPVSITAHPFQSASGE